MNPPNPSAPGKRLSAEQRRQQLLDISMSIFANRGFNATTMDDIATAAGVTKPLLYQHFDSKRALYLELLDTVARTMLEAIGQAVARAPGPRKRVEDGFAAYFNLVMTHPDAFQLLFAGDAPNDPELSIAFRHIEDISALAVNSLITAPLDEEHRMLLAHAVVGMARGASRFLLASRSLSEPESDEIREKRVDRMALHLADLAWAGLRSVHPDL